MDQKSSAFHIYKQTLIRRNSVPISSVYSYDPKDKIGQGAYGSVFKAIHKVSKQIRAVKVINKLNIKYKERLLSEITIMELLDHPNILRVFETFEDNENLYMVLEICQGGDVFDKVLEKGNLSIDEAFKVYIQYMRAVNYYQGFKIVHRDLKPENFLFQKKDDLNTLIVIDFGIAKRGVDKLKTKSGTAYYVAPEVLEGSYDSKCDIWSSGVILYVILCGYPPFYGENEKEILTEIRNAQLQFDGDEWQQIPQEIKDFIKVQICPAAQRSSPKDLLANKLVDKFNQKFQVDQKLISMLTINQWVKFNPLKRLGLYYLATQINSSDLKQQKMAFFLINTTQSGLITQAELASYLKVNKQDIQKVWPYLDCNNNGYLDYFEFIAITLTPQDYNNHLQLIFDFLSQQEKLITQKTIKSIFDQNCNLDKKWDSISDTKSNHHQNTHDHQVNVKNIIEKDVNFADFKAIMG
ncbi:unnamed protein product [Paramecium octaurelia]|uniref:non-specific serine/threonine protein kinase n=1 Tax=Paramecium octaurelia TaxID=43137 RepID=A0A8S1T6F5_PAROT|nr:unnamed protein product [Paramecium octaurelia]